jgi:hypothetical protein
MNEMDRHMYRLRYNAPLDCEPRGTLRPWCVVVLWLVAAFLFVATFTTFGGW